MYRKELPMTWWNFRTGEYDDGSGPETDYIKQDRLSQDLFCAYVAMGYTPKQAMQNILEIYVGELPSQKLNKESK